MPRERLPDRLARRIQLLIESGARGEGERLPAIGEMARRFGVGHQSVREALKKLETMGVVDIRHGSGVYVRHESDGGMLQSSDAHRDLNEKTLIDLIRARIPLESQAAQEAAAHATSSQLRDMRKLLATAAAERDDDALHALNLGFHKLIVSASGNLVLAQLLDVLQKLFGDKQRFMLGIMGSRAQDHEEHVAILEAIERGDELLAHARMQTHLQNVQNALVIRDGLSVSGTSVTSPNAA